MEKGCTDRIGDGDMKKIAVVRSDFPEKFGIPRQSGIVEELKAEIIFEPEFRDPHCVMGLEEYSHIWILWEFSGNVKAGWSPTVIPPRLGGKIHKGVFATRSPFRPNPIGLSCVKLDSIEIRPGKGPVLHVSGADLLDGTPVYDIKPYLRYTDCHPEAVSGFADQVQDYELRVEFPQELLELLPEEKRSSAVALLAQDPRPAYQDDPDRRYGTAFAGWDIRYHVSGGVLTVCEVVPYRTKAEREAEESSPD